jgi:hypothetical protein
MSENLEFDFSKARKERDEGIRRVADNSQEFLVHARTTAWDIAKRKGTVTTDDIRKECDVLPHHPNAWGAVFKAKYFKWTGEYRQSEVVSRHGGMQRVWRVV